MDDGLVRAAVSSDAPGIAAVHTQAWREAYAELLPADYPAGRIITADSWRSHLEEPGVAVVVAEMHGELVGFAAVGPATPEGGPREGTLAAIYLLAAYWGQGLGHRLHEAAVNALGDLGFGAAILWVFSDNARTIAFYDRHGWVADGATLQEVIGGRTMQESRFRRPIG